MTKNYNFEAGEVLLIDKPLHWTSFDVIKKIRNQLWKIAGKKLKVGHAGTLDPLATGLLIICTGKMTKQIDTFQAQTKVYEGELCLGKTTPSYDAETEPSAIFDISHINPESILAIIPQFLGEIMQYPPIFSALKQQGKPLYQLARKGQEVKVEPRPIRVDSLTITQIDLPFVQFKVTCSKGTYIRSLAHDLGKALQAGAYLTALRRTQIGDFEIQNALSLEDFLMQMRDIKVE